jgi:hypothetical protein
MNFGFLNEAVAPGLEIFKIQIYQHKTNNDKIKYLHSMYSCVQGSHNCLKNTNLHVTTANTSNLMADNFHLVRGRKQYTMYPSEKIYEWVMVCWELLY